MPQTDSGTGLAKLTVRRSWGFYSTVLLSSIRADDSEGGVGQVGYLLTFLVQSTERALPGTPAVLCLAVTVTFYSFQ